MKNLLIVVLSILLMLVGCAHPSVEANNCLSEECRLDKLTDYCDLHGGLREFSNIDDDHYYAICNNHTYFIVSYGKISTFVLDLDEFK